MTFTFAATGGERDDLPPVGLKTVHPSILLLDGCATPEKPRIREDFKAILHHYNIQANERYLEMELWSAGRKEPSVSLLRLIPKEGRLHCAAFTLRQPSLASADRDKYLAYLKTATLIGDKRGH